MAAYENLTPEEAQNISDAVNRALTKRRISLNRLAKEAGVSQPMAHNVRQGGIKKRTASVRRLELYLHIVLGDAQPDVTELHQDILEYLGAGGDVVILKGLIRTFTASLRL